MIIIADSGSTKCDWMLLKDWEPLVECNTMGFNPYFYDTAAIVEELNRKAELMEYAGQISHVYFYGAGCATEELRSVVRGALQVIYPEAKVHVSHDLDGAALATYTGEPHIAGILGTGSNSCFFDGKNIHQEVPALAYILGDEGSGSYYGKQLLADFLYRRMPTHLYDEFRESYDLSKNAIMTAVYLRPHANVYLASFMRFCSKHKEDPYIREKVLKGMRDFLETHVACYDNATQVPVNFVGSVAWYFQDELEEVASSLGIRIGKVVKKPIHGLLDYHKKYTFSDPK